MINSISAYKCSFPNYLPRVDTRFFPSGLLVNTRTKRLRTVLSRSDEKPESGSGRQESQQKDSQGVTGLGGAGEDRPVTVMVFYRGQTIS